jgi:hypothetical protein
MAEYGDEDMELLHMDQSCMIESNIANLASMEEPQK